jgi:sugar lactone lactonase YvrE
MKFTGLFATQVALAFVPAALLAFAAPPAQAQTIVGIGSGFQDPAGLVADSSGNVFVADYRAGVVREIVAPAYTTVKTVGGAISSPVGVALDSSGNLYVASQASASIIELTAASGYGTKKTIGSGFNGPTGVAVDASGNVFVADQSNNQIKEIPGGTGAPVVLGSGFKLPAGVAVDTSGNVFVADTANNAVKEILAAGGYSTVKTLGSGFAGPTGVALDSSGNLYVADTENDGIKELLADGGYTTILPVGLGFNFPQGVAVDSHGNIFVGDSGDATVKEMLAAPPPVVASVLPGSRSVQVGSPATIFASMINSGSAALTNCQVLLPITSPAGLSFNYQTTNPNTNALTGSPDTPVTIAGNGGLQTFLITFRGTQAFSAPAMPIAFLCAGAAIQEANVVPGVDTLDLTMSSTAVADVIALAATPTSNGILEMSVNGAAAFAVASTNVGVTAPLTVSVDTGNASLPLAVSICQSNPSNGQCLAPAAPSVSLTYAGGTAPTFSVFAAATGSIAFNPAATRIFVRFKDSSGGLHGSTSVAVETE